jgi:hypothetical protein
MPFELDFRSRYKLRGEHNLTNLADEVFSPRSFENAREKGRLSIAETAYDAWRVAEIRRTIMRANARRAELTCECAQVSLVLSLTPKSCAQHSRGKKWAPLIFLLCPSTCARRKRTSAGRGRRFASPSWIYF